MACFLIKDCKILPLRELQKSLQVRPINFQVGPYKKRASQRLNSKAWVRQSRAPRWPRCGCGDATVGEAWEGLPRVDSRPPRLQMGVSEKLGGLFGGGCPENRSPTICCLSQGP